MGSFAASVDLAEGLRAWAEAGLEFLLAPGGDVFAQPLDDDAEGGGSGEPHSQAPTQPSLQAALAADAPLPEPWSTLAARVRIPPRVIITYASLAEDLTGNADPGRRRLFQNVLAFLGWPAGTTLFWPIRFARAHAVPGLYAVDVFSEGVRRFAVRHVLCFGEDTAAQVLTLYPADAPASGVRVHQAPRPEQLLGLLPHELHQALAHLKLIALD
jgi:hypothetical protein